MARALRQEDGQASVEYALLAALLSIVAIGVMAALGLQVQSLYQAIVDVFP